MEKNGQTPQCRFQSTLTVSVSTSVSSCLRNTSRATCEQNVGLICSVKQSPVIQNLSSQWHLCKSQVQDRLGYGQHLQVETIQHDSTYLNLNMYQSEHSVKTSPHSCFITLWSIHIFHQFSTASAATATSMLYASIATLLTDVFHVDHVTGKGPRFCPCASRSNGNSHLQCGDQMWGFGVSLLYSVNLSYVLGNLDYSKYDLYI